MIAASLEICLCSVLPCQLSRGAPPQILGQPLDSAKYQLLFDSYQYSLQLYPLGLMEINWQLQFGWFLRLTIPSLWVSRDDRETPVGEIMELELIWWALFSSQHIQDSLTLNLLPIYDAIIWGLEKYLCSAMKCILIRKESLDLL